jgi:NADP-dependent 3-hydroxy acid dehydrogenase YdfG
LKIAITGHSAGIGQALAKIYESRGHEIVGVSRRTGGNIRSLSRILNLIEPCDMLINNAQIGFAQTELLFSIWEIWKNTNKTIINIGTQMTNDPVATREEWDAYRVQKVSLDTAHYQLRARNSLPKMILVKPGAVATQDNQYPPEYADVDEWANTLFQILEIVNPNLEISEIALGPKNES